MGGGAFKGTVPTANSADLNSKTIIQSASRSANEAVSGRYFDDAAINFAVPAAVSQACSANHTPIPLTNSSSGGNAARVLCGTLDDVMGPEGGDTKYIKQRMIGKGAFGEAYIVVRNPNYNAQNHYLTESHCKYNTAAKPTTPRAQYVAKVLDFNGMSFHDTHYTRTEIMCLANAEHFAIIRYYEHYMLDSDEGSMVIIMEFADHGDLHGNLTRSSATLNGKGASTRLRLSEREAGMYFLQLLLALNHVHNRRMIHRDVKVANLFLTSSGFMKLGDFGFSQKYDRTVSSETVAGTFLGTPYYVAPEMWRGTRYGKKADVWAAAVVLYEMLMDGQRPFEGGSMPELRDSVLNKELQLPEYLPGDVMPQDGEEAQSKRRKLSAEMRDLVKSMFCKDPQQRPSTDELLHTPIMQHYLCLFEKHVHNLIMEDHEKRRANPACDPLGLHFRDESDKALVLKGIEEAKALIASVIQKEISSSTLPRYEGVIYKNSSNGVWKERYLILAENVLTICLSKGKEAAGGAERSKKVALRDIQSVNPCVVEEAHVKAAAAAAGPIRTFKPSHAFAICMTSANSIVFGVADEKELDNWMSSLMRALTMD